MLKWARPECAPFPSVWSTFESKNIINGCRRKYWIQDLTDEYKEEVLHLMSTRFIDQEPLTKYSRLADDPQSLEEFLTIWKDMVDQKLCLICLTKDENDVTHLVGCNMLYVSQKGDPKITPKGKSLNMICGALYDLYGMKDPYAELDVDAYLNAMGLYVLPEFRGDGIGTEILKARRGLSLAVGLKVSVTLFTSIGGQKSAEKAEFKDIIVFPYKDLKTLNSSYEFTGIESDNTKLLRVMYARYSE